MDPNLNTVERDDILQLLNQTLKRVSKLENEVVQLKGKTNISLLASSSGIDAKTTATHTLLTVPSGKTLVVTDVVVRVNGFTVGSKTIQAIANLGGNSANFNDFISGKTYTFSANGQLKRENNNDTQIVTYAAATNFSLKITTGSNATLENWDVEVYGYYV